MLTIKRKPHITISLGLRKRENNQSATVLIRRQKPKKHQKPTTVKNATKQINTNKK